MTKPENALLSAPKARQTFKRWGGHKRGFSNFPLIFGCFEAVWQIPLHSLHLCTLYILNI